MPFMGVHIEDYWSIFHFEKCSLDGLAQHKAVCVLLQDEVSKLKMRPMPRSGNRRSVGHLEPTPASQFLQLFRVAILTCPSRRLARQIMLPWVAQCRREKMYAVLKSQFSMLKRVLRAIKSDHTPGNTPRRHGRLSSPPCYCCQLCWVSVMDRCRWPEPPAVATTESQEKE